MINFLSGLFEPTSHLKASTLAAQPGYFTYTNEGWMPITKAQFDSLVRSGRFYKHESASTKYEFIYNRKR